MKRREFIISTTALLLAQCGATLQLERPQQTGSPQDILERHQEKYLKTIKDPYGYKKFLRKGEFIVPNNVLVSYVCTSTPQECIGLYTTVQGFYQGENYLGHIGKEEEFKEDLMLKGFSKKEADLYTLLVTSEDIIVLNQSSLESKTFEENLPHERMHRKLRNLSHKEKKLLYKAYKKLCFKKNKDGTWFVKGKIQAENPDAPPFVTEVIDYKGQEIYRYLALSQKMWEEMYTYMAQGKFAPFVEKEFKLGHPKAYQIYHQLKEESKIKLLQE